jgi:iron-sulfur cluster assembly protein
VTERAAKKVVALAEKSGKPKILRVGVKGGGCSGLSYFWDFDSEQRADDISIEVMGLKVICDPKSLKYLEGASLDYEDRNLLKAGFKFTNPQAKRSCSCGESFSV